MKSILQTKKECYVCRRKLYRQTVKNLEEHHIIFGGLRSWSERNGLKVWLCYEHHRGGGGVHHNEDLRQWLCAIAQTEWEKSHTHDEWMQIVQKDYTNEQSIYEKTKRGG